MSFTGKWILANTSAMFVSYLLYTPIAHGITGGHEHYLTLDQLLAHIIALIVVAVILFLSQRYVLKKYINISWPRIIFSVVAFLILFYIGYYQEFIPGELDTDILMGYVVLGSGMWIGAVKTKGHWLAILIAVLSFPFASFIGEVLLFFFVTGLDLNLDLQFDALHHTIFWEVVGVTTGLLGGWISGLALSKVIGQIKEK